MVDTKRNQVVESSDAEVFIHNGISPFATETRISRQVVVVQNPTLVIKFKQHEVYQLCDELRAAFKYNDVPDMINLLISTLSDYIENPPKMEGVEPETVFSD